MKDYINYIAFGTFGNPYGFTQTVWLGDKTLEGSIRTFDINNSALNLFPETTLYAIRKENLGNQIAIAYSKYTFARERNSTRGGTFIGSSILILDHIVNTGLVVSCLDELHDNLVSNNVVDDVLQVEHSKYFKIKKDPPRDYDKLGIDVKKIKGISLNPNGKSLVVYFEEDKIAHLHNHLDEAIHLLSKYDTIYFTTDKQVAAFVEKKGLFNIYDLTTFRNQINSIKEKKAKEKNKLLFELKRQYNQAIEQEQTQIENFINLINENNNIHRKNISILEKNQIEKDNLVKIFKELKDGINSIINKVQNDDEINIIKNCYQELTETYNKKKDKIFNENKVQSVNNEKIKENRPLKHIDSGAIYNQYNTTGASNDNSNNISEWGNNQHSKSSNNSKKYKTLIRNYKLVCALLLIALLTTLFYFLLIHEVPNKVEVETQQSINTNVKNEYVNDLNSSTSSKTK